MDPVESSLKRVSLFLVLSVFIANCCCAQGRRPVREDPAEWSRPFPPFQIAGNLYYVGTYELGCYLITTAEGNILINTGLAGSAPAIEAAVRQLGFRFSDIRILLTSQAHRDHVGAMAEMKRRTGAKFMVDAGDSAVISDGGRSDYADAGHFVPVPVDRYLHDGDTISLGNMHLLMFHHPGHTKGSCSFLFTVSDTNRTFRVLIANFPTIITDKKFSAISAYPGIAADYAATLSSLKALSFDIWLSPHASQFDLHGKEHPGDPYHPEKFIDRIGYDAVIGDLQSEFNEKLKQK